VHALEEPTNVGHWAQLPLFEAIYV